LTAASAKKKESAELEAEAQDTAAREAPAKVVAPVRQAPTAAPGASGARSASAPKPQAAAPSSPPAAKNEATRDAAGHGRDAPGAPREEKTSSKGAPAEDRKADADASPAERKDTPQAEPPDAVVTLTDAPDRVRQVQQLVLELKGYASPPERLANGQVRLRLILPKGAYPKLVAGLRSRGALGATPPPSPAREVQKVWVEINSSR
jgi:hypothetical protein